MQQKRYLQRLREKFGMKDCKPKYTPNESIMNTQEVGRLRTWFITAITTARTTIYKDGVVPLHAGKNDGC